MWSLPFVGPSFWAVSWGSAYLAGGRRLLGDIAALRGRLWLSTRISCFKGEAEQADIEKPNLAARLSLAAIRPEKFGRDLAGQSAPDETVRRALFLRP